MKLKFAFLLFIGIPALLYSQRSALSPEAEISVLTIGPGISLNDSFGHNAFRVKDPVSNIDLVFNYGVYDFDTPNFYGKFAQGKLNYKLGVNYYQDFYKAYVAQDRSIKEQFLNLIPSDEQRLYNYLLHNYKPENRYYLYDFFYDNCATKIKDVLNDALNNEVRFEAPKDFDPETFRTLIQNELHYNSWGSLGIDIALGSVIDRPALPEEHMFLPKYIYAFFENATINNSQQLVRETTVLYESTRTKTPSFFLGSPLMIMGIAGLLILAITFWDQKKNRLSRWLDMAVFTITGLIGVFILLLWFATDHTATAMNYNLLWAFALNLIVIPQVLRRFPKNWFRKYLKFLVIMLVLLTLHWILGVQVFAKGLIPLLIALLVRYLYLIRYFKSLQSSK
jgi:hypothetical protein